MKTPIYDFVNEYSRGSAIRMHMPGHKGVGELGEDMDITEIEGADSLYEANGIIAESEKYASELFGARTFYSTEGSSLSIRAMLYLTVLYAKERGESPLIFAGRNAHRSFVSAAVLLDFDLEWLTPDNGSYLSCPITAGYLRERLRSADRLPTAVYITTPDYLGNTLDVYALAKECHELGVLLLCDNAHGAYLKFLSPSRHPIDLGADMCADSAHKTLPSLTGAAYLHVSKNAPNTFVKHAKEAMAMFGSTSPSYRILASLDLTNRYLKDGFANELSAFVCRISKTKDKIQSLGYELAGDEPLKITLVPKTYGYTGRQLCVELVRLGVVCEFADPDFVVLMPSPISGEKQLDALSHALSQIPKREPIAAKAPRLTLPRRVMSPREACMSQRESLSINQCAKKVLAAVTVGCPPAVPILVAGEEITPDAISAFEYYGNDNILVVK